MPELPEVETVANGVHDRTHGQRILEVWTSGKPQTFKSPESQIIATLTNAQIQTVRRVGKTIVMTLTQPAPASMPDNLRTQALLPSPTPPDPGARSAQFLIHLGMTGRLLVSSPDVPVPPHTHAILSLSGGNQLRFVDARRFGRLSIHTPEKDQASYAGPGAEPLTISEPDFIALFHARRTPIKAALLNQSILHGVGNIYADESLFRAGIRPRRQAARLTRKELAALRLALIDVLHHAIQLGGSSVSDYVDAEGVRGFFQLEHRVYSRTGKPCRVCQTPIQKITVAGRSTHFCPTCQH
jgi:formamidopyrimidine-DNA glycosylase